MKFTLMIDHDSDYRITHPKYAEPLQDNVQVFFEATDIEEFRTRLGRFKQRIQVKAKHPDLITYLYDFLDEVIEKGWDEDIYRDHGNHAFSFTAGNKEDDNWYFLGKVHL